jgi:small subunit ribosomal protein S21
VAGVHGLKHVERLGAARLADNDTVRLCDLSESGGRRTWEVRLRQNAQGRDTPRPRGKFRLKYPKLQPWRQNNVTIKEHRLFVKCENRRAAFGGCLAEIRFQEGETIENALRRFKRKVLQEDIIKEVKRHSFYLKPGEKKRVKQALAQKRNRKKNRRDFTAEPSR